MQRIMLVSWWYTLKSQNPFGFLFYQMENEYQGKCDIWAGYTGWMGADYVSWAWFSFRESHLGLSSLTTMEECCEVLIGI